MSGASSAGGGSPPREARDLARRKTLQLLACVAGIYISYLAYGVLQEALYRVQSDGSTFAATAFVLLVQCLGNALIALLCSVVNDAVGFEKRVAHKSKGADGELRSEPLQSYWSVLVGRDVLLVAFVYVFAMYTSNEALKYVSYPAQALAKSCKMVPVMIGSIVLAGKRYAWQKYAAVALVTLGITAFQFAAPTKKSKGGHKGGDAGTSEAAGLGLLALSLVFDGLSGPGQELIKRHGLTNFQQMLASNTWATVYMAVCAYALGQVNSSVSGGSGGGGGGGLRSVCIMSCPPSLTLRFPPPSLAAARVPELAPQLVADVDPLCSHFRSWAALHLLLHPRIRLACPLHHHHNAQVLYYRPVHRCLP